MTKNKTIIIYRHGHTAHDAERDVHLSKLGKQQAAQLKEECQLLILSNLRRSIETYTHSQIIADSHIINPLFRECMDSNNRNYLLNEEIGRENTAARKARALLARNYILEIPEQTIVIMSHQGFIWHLLQKFGAKPLMTHNCHRICLTIEHNEENPLKGLKLLKQETSTHHELDKDDKYEYKLPVYPFDSQGLYLTGGNTKKEHKLILVMIVKNEGKNMQRCLEAAKPVINGVCITDTGSKDDTIKVISTWCKDNELPYAIYRHPFHNFGQARTQSYVNARAAFPNSDYFLLLDGDMVLVVKDNWHPQQLTTNVYKLYQQNNNTRYENIRIIKASIPWKCELVTHEYWQPQLSAKKVGSYESLSSLEIDDRDDGGSKDDKFPRDAYLINTALNDTKTPQHHIVRYHFYLGQTYMSLCKYRKCIKCYKMRISEGGYDEEVWYSYCQIARAYKYMGKRSKAINYYLEAYGYRPTRAEPLCELAELYRGGMIFNGVDKNKDAGKNRLAYTYAKMALECGYPIKDSLFILSDVYDWKIDYELSIACYHVQDEELGAMAQRRLMSKIDRLPSWVKASVLDNNKFYAS